MKEALLTAGLALLSTGGYSQTSQQIDNLNDIISTFESVRGIQECYSKLSKFTNEITPEKIKEACFMSAYSHALYEGYANAKSRQAIYELDSLVQNHKISPQYQKNLLSSNTLELAKSKYMAAKAQQENSFEQNNDELQKKCKSLKNEYEAIAEIQTGAKHVQLLNPQFDANRISKYLQGAFYMKDVFENWELHSSDDKAGFYFDCLKMDIQSYPYGAAKYIENIFDKTIPEKLAKEFYDSSQKFADGLSDSEYDKIDMMFSELLNPELLKGRLELPKLMKKYNVSDTANNKVSQIVKPQQQQIKKAQPKGRPLKTLPHRKIGNRR